jgi:hypothetical protein
MPAQRDGLHEHPKATADAKVELSARARGDLSDEPRAANIDLDELRLCRIGGEAHEGALETVAYRETARGLDRKD